ncbi:hypothetical protein Q0F99_07425 [Rathayibacter oskolensis]|nr:hypothetical protein [Rathayibacter oskolensis]WKK73450.1 hypothetical protein Q0F99_07425 [Rathayibacter oskolensis]
MSTTTAEPSSSTGSGAARASTLGSAWRRFLLRRALGLLVNLALLVLVTFLIVQLIPGDPAIAIAGSRRAWRRSSSSAASSGSTSRCSCSSGPT